MLSYKLQCLVAHLRWEGGGGACYSPLPLCLSHDSVPDDDEITAIWHRLYPADLVLSLNNCTSLCPLMVNLNVAISNRMQK